MFKIAGVILCIAGSAGYGMLKVSGWKSAVKELEQWILLFEKMKNRIYYRRDIITDIFCRMDEEIYGICGKYVMAVGCEIKMDRSKDVAQAWRERMEEWKKNSMLPGEIKKLLMQFPEYIGEQDYEQQISNLDFYLHKLRREKELLEKELSNKKKPVMAISLVSGIVVPILLL